ncbi:hypothetical protein EJ03DRAFT_332605 [Teratosphaeria nubilosa]|uniref:Uncharacterized protein n=1 Tax=Teratosphaeria nubilosa TaxID=161662 RepID=A0A6G1KTW3_9PEZI|nr:hypothetical protein EJ03DRAFT_332605 [Teratosphaeria nubilosa]
MFSKLLLTASALATIASAGTINVDNHCGFALYLTSAFGSGNDGVHSLSASSDHSWTGPITNDKNEQHALTISKSPDMSSPLQNVYNVANGITYYSLSTIYGDPLKSEGFHLDSAGNGFDLDSPKGRQGDLEHAYTPSNPSGNGAVFTDSTNSDFTLVLCL